MKKTIFLFTYIFIIFSVLSINAQTDTSIINSNSKVIIDGKEYYIHKVEKKQTLYAISKLYNVSQKTITDNNLNVKENIGIGQFLKIPIIKNQKTLSDNTDENDKFLSHIIKKGETIYSLSKIYNVKIEEIYKLNPQSKNYITIGDTIVVPKIFEIFEPEINKKEDSYIYHKVEKKQTLYAISKLYDVKVRQIKKANPELKNNSIQEGQIIKIPIKNNIKLQASVVEVDTIIKPIVLPAIDTTIHPCNDNFNYTNQVFNVALMLPFYTNINDTLGVSDSLIQLRKNKIYSKSNIFIEFYQGILLSVEKLKEQNVSINLYVYDTQNDTMQIKNILQNNELKEMDLIIGPVYSSNLQIVSKFSKENHISIVSPLSLKDTFLINNPYAFQISPTISAQIKYTSEYLNSFSAKNFLVIHDGKNINTNLLSDFKTKLFNTISKSKHEDYNYTEIYYYQKEDSLVHANLSPTSKNIIIIPSENRAFVSDIVAKLNAFSRNYDITLFGRPNWVRFDNIQPENFHNLNAQIFTNSYIDYKKKDVKDFVKKFRSSFKTEPSKFSFQAFDISYYFISALKQYGKDFQYCLQSFDIPLLETEFYFERKDNNSSFENKALYIITYDKNYDVVITSSLPKKTEQK